MWSFLLQTNTRIETQPHVYTEIVSSPLSNEIKAGCLRKIKVDLPRSMPGHPILKSEEGQKALAQVLMAFATRDSELQYCQGLNFLVAELLCNLSEEEAFWGLIQLLTSTRFNLRSFFTKDVPLLRQSLRRFQEAIEETMPDLAEHLEAQNVPVTCFAPTWLHTVFVGADSMPKDILDHIWDCFLIDGPDFVFSCSLACLRLLKDSILTAECEEIMRITHFDSWDRSLGGLLIDTSLHILLRHRSDNGWS